MSETTQVLAACPHDCPDTCSMVVTVEDGRVTKVRGNPDHPFTRGGLCVKVTDYPNHLYSDDRITTPLRRVGAKGDGEFKVVSFYAKQARGAMAGWMVRERITAISALPDFSELGYRFDERRSSDDAPVFTRRNDG